MKKYSAVTLLALALSACGGGGGGGSSDNATTAQGDSFVNYVASLIGTSGENDDPVAIDAVAETKPENTDPAPVQ